MDESITPPEPGTEVDPAARTEEDEANAPTPTETSQDVPAEEVSPAEQDPLQPGGDPANQVARTSAPLPEQQGGAPNPDDIGDRAPAQTASTSTDRPSVPSDPQAQGDADPPEGEAADGGVSEPGA